MFINSKIKLWTKPFEIPNCVVESIINEENQG